MKNSFQLPHVNKTKEMSIPEQQQKYGFRIGIVSAYAHADVIQPLVESTTNSLMKNGLSRRDIVYMHVVRPYDLPAAAKLLIDQEKEKLDGVICLGLLVRDELADRFAFQSQAIAQGIMKLNVKGSIPVLYGVLTCLNHEQACKFIGEGEGEHVSVDHGSEWACAMMELIRVHTMIMCGDPIVPATID